MISSMPRMMLGRLSQAERSTFRWGGGDHRRIESSGGGVHVLEDAGHWVHSDNPEGLVEIMRPSFSNRT